MNPLSFVAALGLTPRDLRKMVSLRTMFPDERNPFENALVSPLFTDTGSLNLIKQLKERGEIESLYFDSGGYQVQRGRADFSSVYSKLREFYIDNTWADYYVLPDIPPVTGDTPARVAEKVRQTVETTRKFFLGLPPYLREKSIAVVQGRELDQIHYCLVNYVSDLGIRNIGFGSFGTTGVDSSINLLDQESLQALAFITHNYPNMRVHAFGVGNPPVAYVLGNLGVSSFDSSGWIKAAAYGNVYLPYTRAYNVSFRRIERGRGALDCDQFMALKDLTRHECPFCEDFYRLSHSRDYRFMHNVLCMVDTVRGIHDHQQAQRVISAWSPTYSKYIFKEVG